MTDRKQKKSQVHEDLQGLELHVNEFGEVVMNKSNEEINRFLDEHVEDKKLNSLQRNKQEEE